jgi:hypothetical protein
VLKGTVAIALSLSPSVALAYFDPGTGSLLIQAVIGAMAAAAVFWGNLKAFARSLLSRLKTHSSAAVNEDRSADHSIDSN